MAVPVTACFFPAHKTRTLFLPRLLVLVCTKAKHTGTNYSRKNFLNSRMHQNWASNKISPFYASFFNGVLIPRQSPLKMPAVLSNSQLVEMNIGGVCVVFLGKGVNNTRQIHSTARRASWRRGYLQKAEVVLDGMFCLLYILANLTISYYNGTTVLLNYTCILVGRS